MQRRVLVTGLLALAACGPRRLPPPPSAPHVSAAAELIPADLDVVARLDLSRMKAALGAITPELLSRDVLSRTSGGGGDEPDQLIVESLLAADLVYLGYRPSPQLLPLDRVLALQGRFEALSRPSGFSGPTDLGADVRYWERLPGPTPLARSGSARVYAIGDRVRGFVSEAEIDAVERLLERGTDHRLEPAAEGTLSVALRPRFLADRVGSGRLQDLLRDADELRGVVLLESDRVRIKASLSLQSDAQAAELVRAAREVSARLLGDRADPIEFRAEGSRALLSAELRRSDWAPLLGCFRDGAERSASCPW